MLRSLQGRLPVILLCLIFFASACSTNQSLIDKVESSVQWAEENLETYSSDDWQRLESEIQELTYFLEIERKNLNSNEIERIGRIQGRYLSLRIKSGMGELKDAFEDYGNQLKGVLKGLE